MNILTATANINYSVIHFSITLLEYSQQPTQDSECEPPLNDLMYLFYWKIFNTSDLGINNLL